MSFETKINIGNTLSFFRFQTGLKSMAPS